MCVASSGVWLPKLATTLQVNSEWGFMLHCWSLVVHKNHTTCLIYGALERRRDHLDHGHQ